MRIPSEVGRKSKEKMKNRYGRTFTAFSQSQFPVLSTLSASGGPFTSKDIYGPEDYTRWNDQRFFNKVLLLIALLPIPHVKIGLE